jgi:hypothetical protein
MVSRPTKTTKPGVPFGRSEPRRQPQQPQNNDPGPLPQGDAGDDSRELNVGSGDRPKTPKPGTGR